MCYDVSISNEHYLHDLFDENNKRWSRILRYKSGYGFSMGTSV